MLLAQFLCLLIGIPWYLKIVTIGIIETTIKSIGTCQDGGSWHVPIKAVQLTFHDMIYFAGKNTKYFKNSNKKSVVKLSLNRTHFKRAKTTYIG